MASAAAIKVTFLEAKGIYKKTVGRALNGRGELVPRNFYLGKDKSAAERAALQLSQRWNEIEQAGGDQWGAEDLEWAAAVIAGGKMVVAVTPEVAKVVAADRQLGAKLYASHINSLKGTPGVTVVAEDHQLYADGCEALEIDEANSVAEATAAEMLAAEATQDHAKRFGKPSGSVANLYAALDEFKSFVLVDKSKGGKPTQWAVTFEKAVERLKTSTPDMPLSAFGFDAINAMARYWRNRPNRKGTDKPISVDTVELQFKAIRQFIDWLDGTEKYQWQEPRRWRKGITLKGLAAEDAINKRRGLVRTFTLDDLTILYREASEQEKCWVLLALNCGFASAEIASLTMEEVDFKKGKLCRVRRKSGVWGEWVLWPETLAALHAAFLRREAVAKQLGQKLSGESLVFVSLKGTAMQGVTAGGNRYDKIGNEWWDIFRKCEQKGIKVKYQGFKYLRKTAGDLLKRFSDCEVAATFLAHGKTNSDALTDDYTNRRYGAVAEALAKVRDYLAAAICGVHKMAS